ncbi:hypothetical protein SBRCBS47491_002411 [Sporothrix bragantina]|uniref:Uncharacterized protein n=1 Tax=Sporothrix bragantina TaxID=671064 RepID=A0ABP0B6S3_9PEZI
MTAPSTALVAALALLVADATIELGFITSMVAYLHGGLPSGTYSVNTPASVRFSDDNASPTYRIQGKPLHVVINQGHTSNGAAGSAIVLIGIVGTIALILRHRAPGNKLGRALYYFWMGLQVPTLLLTLIALAYTFAAVNAHRGQTIDQTVAYNTQPGPYAKDSWTPQNWFAAVLELHLTDPDVRSNLAMHLRIMRGWQYNLIPLFLIQLLETVVAFIDFRAWRGMRNDGLGTNAASTGNEKYYSSNDYNGPHGGVQEEYSGQPLNNNANNANNGYNTQYAPQQPYQDQSYTHQQQPQQQQHSQV